jgi:hypothetical protein
MRILIIKFLAFIIVWMWFAMLATLSLLVHIIKFPYHIFIVSFDMAGKMVDESFREEV